MIFGQRPGGALWGKRVLGGGRCPEKIQAWCVPRTAVGHEEGAIGKGVG
jgi:hypothetical protein